MDELIETIFSQVWESVPIETVTVVEVDNSAGLLLQAFESCQIDIGELHLEIDDPEVLGWREEKQNMYEQF